MKRPYKRIAFIVLTAVFAWALVEILAFAGYWLVNGRIYAPSEVSETIRSRILPHTFDDAKKLSIGGVSDVWNSNVIEVLHPYFGFVPDPDRNPGVSDFGFLSLAGDGPLIRKKSPDKLIVGIFGGSFAENVYAFSANTLAGSLKSEAREALVLNFSAAGYKQPQQLIVLAFMLSLGAEFDLIINIDGFNEVVLPPHENTPNGVYPFYPRMWYYRTRNLTDPQEIRQLGQIEFLKEKRSRWASFCLNRSLYRSPFSALLWQAGDRLFQREVFARTADIRRIRSVKTPYVVSGPDYACPTEEECYRDLARVWMRSSVQMKALCDANGIRYYHFLQPNQYVSGSKPMTAAERNIALTDNHPYRPGVVKGYPQLRTAGETLKKSGVNYTDLTMVFSQHPEPLYIDNCCHLGKEGCDLIVWHIAGVIGKSSP